MDKKVFTMALLTIVSAFILVLVIVYATNTDRINELLGIKSTQETEPDTAASYMSGDAVYGDQIGSNLDAFLYDDDFFDETEKIPSVVVIKKSSASSDMSGESASLDSSSDMDEENGTGMAVVGELHNPDATGEMDPGAFDSTLFEYNGVMPSAPPIEGTPVGTAVGNN